MKVHLDVPITDLAGNPIKDGDKFLTLEKVCVTALVNVFPGDENMKRERKFELYQLAVKLHGNETAELTAEEIARCKERVAVAYAPLVMGRAFDLLENA